MAYLKSNKSRNGKTYYQSEVKNPNWNKSLLISLKTTDYKLAVVRHQEVEDNEKAIKRGIQFDWSWANEGRTRVKKISVQSLIEEWLDVRSTNARASSVKRYRVSLNAFTKIIGKACPVNAINTNTIESFKKAYKGKHTTNGININLRGIKGFLLWAKTEEFINKMPKIKLLPIDKSKPRIINDANWTRLMELESLSDYWKNIFILYRDTGIRRSEGVYGLLEDNFLVIKAEHSKSGIEKEIAE